MAKARSTTPAVDIALIAVFAALLAALALTPAIPVGAIGVSLTLQTLGVLLAGLVLGPWRGFLSVMLYLVVGFAFRTVVDDQHEAALLRFLDIGERDLRAGPELVGDLAKVGHDASLLGGAILFRRLRWMMFRPSTATENPIAT